MDNITMYLLKLGANIKTIRTSKGISLKQASDDADYMEPSNYIRIESGVTNPTMKSIYRIAKGLGVSIGEIVQF